MCVYSAPCRAGCSAQSTWLAASHGSGRGYIFGYQREVGNQMLSFSRMICRVDMAEFLLDYGKAVVDEL